MPAEEKTLLKIHAGTSKLIPHRDGIKSENPPKLSDEGTEIAVDLLLPQNLLEALPAESRIKVEASNTATGCSPEIYWWRLDGLLADKDDKPISGWLSEQELITTRHSPREWEGFDFLEDTDTPTVRGWLTISMRLVIYPMMKGSAIKERSTSPTKALYEAGSTTSSTPTAILGGDSGGAGKALVRSIHLPARHAT